nr:G protein-coupled receptor [Proales similis]
MTNYSMSVNSSHFNFSNLRQFDSESIVPSVGYLIILIFGSIGNGMTIASTLWFESLRKNPTYLVIMNQALVDLLTSLIVPAAWLAVLVLGEQFLLELELLCQIFAFSNLVFSSASSFSMSLLALNRYLAIVYPQRYKRWFTIKKTGIFCLATWTISFLLEAINYTDFGGRVYDPKIKSCFFDRMKLGCLLVIASVSIGLPCLIILSSYLKIYLFVRKSKTRVHQQSQSKAQKDRLVLAKSLFVIFIVYCVCWLPGGTIFVMDTAFMFDSPSWLFIYSLLLIYANSALNTLIYALTNPTLCEAYMFWIKKLTCSLVFKNLKLNRLDAFRDLTTQI